MLYDKVITYIAILDHKWANPGIGGHFRKLKN